jgi:site-specific DNA-methyltransferase (adenine-specific)
VKLTVDYAKNVAPKFPSFCSALEDVQVDDGAFDVVIADPPYAARTQNNTRRGQVSNKAISAPMPLGFDPATSAKRSRWANWMATATRRWVAVFSDHESSMEWANHLERAGLVYVRCALWIRTGDLEIVPNARPKHSGAPQFTGDRPQAGHEVIVLAHKGKRMRWHNHGKAAIYTAPVVPPANRLHPTEKPIRLMVDILRDFCDACERIVDPFCGAGSTIVAAKRLGMAGAVGIDLDEKWASLASRRAAAATRFQHGQWPMRG